MRWVIARWSLGLMIVLSLGALFVVLWRPFIVLLVLVGVAEGWRRHRLAHRP